MSYDWIRVRKIRAYGYHGIFPEERILGQIFEADVELRVDLTRPAQSDDPADTIDYVDVYRVVERLLTGPPQNLLESLAGQIAEVLLQTYPALYVIIRIRKPGITVSGQVVGAMEVELHRERPV
ncbi:MAG TPA: dihydroneopterin aldolase [candidate division Zixibacteria bacterium]|jgi:dihydroneopterin aldolase|nr:dihydroneopterin aldolase [Candidatus Latescibacterota bacterium]HIG47510.1 dihydroneopterin aldolase [candidate division Zixibacteria bacterium]